VHPGHKLTGPKEEEEEEEAGLVQSRYNFIYVLPFINGFLDRI
jgi:hypothetical protein